MRIILQGKVEYATIGGNWSGVVERLSAARIPQQCRRPGEILSLTGRRAVPIGGAFEVQRQSPSFLTIHYAIFCNGLCVNPL